MHRPVCLITALALLAGCSTSGSYEAYLAAQANANRLAVESQKPLVRITAQPGQSITGLAGIEVYTPNAAPVIQQERPNEWAGVVSQGIGVLGTVGGVIAGGRAAVGLAEAVGDAATRGYAAVQAPGAVTTINTTTTQTTGSHSAIGGDNTISDSTHPPTVVYQPEPVVVTTGAQP